MHEVQRLIIMDKQRFDLSKRQQSRLSIQIAETTAANDKNPPLPLTRPQTANLLAGGVWNHYGRVFVPVHITSASSSNSDGDTIITSDSPHDPPSTNPSSTTTLPVSQDNQNELRQIDVYDHGEFTTTRAIIRPTPRSPTLGFCSAFSCSPSPFSRPSSTCTSRTNLPANLSLGSLTCCSTQNFELDLDAMMQKDQDQPLSGIEVVVSQEVTVQREELWREGVQQVLYGQERTYDMMRVRHEV